MGSARGRSVTGVAALLLSATALAGAAVIANGALAALGGLALIVALLALNRVPRDRDW